MSSYAIMTNVGRNKEAAALANGMSLSITEIAWGDGERSPGGGETALVNEVGRKQVQSNGLVSDALNTAFFEILLDANEGPFVIREAGLFDVDGDLIALAKYDPPVNKPKDTVTALVRINVVFSNLENLILNVQSTDAYVPVERKTSTGVGLLGGGDLSEDRTLAVDFASDAEAVAGTINTKSMTPIRVKQAIAALIGGVASGAGFSVYLGANGYIKLPSWLGGLIIQWGKSSFSASGASSTSKNVTFPISFPTAAFMVVGNAQGPVNSSSGGSPAFATSGVTASTFNATADSLGWAMFNQAVPFNWVAIGH